MMKKNWLLLMGVAAALSICATGCINSTGDDFIAEANEFMAGAEKYKTHEIQKDEGANIMLNHSQQLYLLIGAAIADNIRVRFGEADILIMRQNVENDDNYIKKWEALRYAGRDAKSTAAAEQAQKELTAIIKENLATNKSITKRTEVQFFEAIAAKRAMADLVEQKKRLKEAGSDTAKRAEVVKSYAGMDAWLARGRKELANCYGDEFKKAEAKRAKLMEESQARTKAEFEKIQNKAIYVGLYVTRLTSEIALSKANNDMARMVAQKAVDAAAAQQKELEEKYPYVKEILDPILKCQTNEERLAFAKDLAAQYGYVIEVAGGRLGYTFKAFPWYFASKEALDDASMN